MCDKLLCWRSSQSARDFRGGVTGGWAVAGSGWRLGKGGWAAAWVVSKGANEHHQNKKCRAMKERPDTDGLGPRAE